MFIKSLLSIVIVFFCMLLLAVVSAADEMVTIPEGEFIMGTNDDTSDDERPAHVVFLDVYKIDKYEVSVAEYYGCVKAKVCSENEYISADGINDKYAKPNEPIRGVSWFEALRYCEWKGKRLPTEAEWEKAARGPNNYSSPWGNERLGDRYARLNNVGLGPIGTLEKDKSGYGVYDMAGNVSEWVSDWYSEDYYSKSPKVNATGPANGDEKVLRGENFFTNSRYSTRYSHFGTSRKSNEPTVIHSSIGFRCAK